MMDRPILVNEDAFQRNRNRAAKNFDQLDYIKSAVAERVMDRIDTIRRDLPLVLDVGCHTGSLTELLLKSPKITTVKAFDPSPEMVLRARVRTGGTRTGVQVECASFDRLPFEGVMFDAIVSAFSLHWANDLPGVLVQLQQRLKPDGVLVVALAGGVSLNHLRNCLVSAEIEQTGGMSPRVMPMADIKDMGGLISRAGLTMPVADSDVITVTYPDLMTLMAELRGMGEANAMTDRLKSMTPKSVFLRAAELYAQEYGDADGRIPASFEIITLTGWAADESQPKPLRPGSAKIRLADALGAKEHDPEGHL
ncbi:MAG: methyltransferase domain-containing protein [Candidatus Puniceispirillales bacterium WSBS_2018_MAG_OTU23]